MLKANAVGGSGSRIWSSDGEGFGGGPPLSPILPPMPSTQPSSPRFLQLEPCSTSLRSVARYCASLRSLLLRSLRSLRLASLVAFARFARCADRRARRSLREVPEAAGAAAVTLRHAPPPLWGEGMTDRDGRDDSVVTCRPLSGAPRSTISVVGATRYVEARARTNVRRGVGQGPAT